jgi:uncharacterized zinc-type alcohol dehydrogenase-like protein
MRRDSMIDTVGYAAHKLLKRLEPFKFERKDPTNHDVQIQIMYCGVCHSDLHQVKNEWHNTIYPCLPGHEIIGRVVKTGSGVGKFKNGDIVGVGCMIDSCRECASCQEGLEQYCEKGFLATYNGPFKPDGSNTFGGYSSNIVVNEDFVLRIPPNLKLSSVAPLLCAGVTTYSPLKHWNVKKGEKVGIVGLGGLGHVAVKLAHAMGAEVTVFTTSPEKKEDALRFGASQVVLSTDAAEMKKHEEKYSFILNTIPEKHEVDPYVKTLNRDGVMTMVGVLTSQPGWDHGQIAFKRRSLSGSLIGGIKETQEVLDFCSKHQIVPECEMIAMSEINKAFERMENGEVKYRFVIDMGTLQ